MPKEEDHYSTTEPIALYSTAWNHHGHSPTIQTRLFINLTHQLNRAYNVYIFKLWFLPHKDMKHKKWMNILIS